MKTDLYQNITNQIIRALEQGTRPWHQPWSVEHAAGRVSWPPRAGGIPYQGINVLMLWAAAVEKEFSSPFWFTFKQALDLGAHVRKGEKGSLVVYADRITRTETDTAPPARARAGPRRVLAPAAQGATARRVRASAFAALVPPKKVASDFRTLGRAASEEWRPLVLSAVRCAQNQQ